MASEEKAFELSFLYAGPVDLFSRSTSHAPELLPAGHIVQ